MSNEMYVIKRNGQKQRVSFDKISKRIRELAYDLNLERVNTDILAKETIDGIYNGIKTSKLDELTAQLCAEKIIEDDEYSKLSAGITISNMHKNTEGDFKKVIDKLYYNYNEEGEHLPRIQERIWKFVNENEREIKEMIDYERDFDNDTFSIGTLQRGYLLRDRKTKEIIERPQDLLMRVTLGIVNQDINEIKETYDLLSKKYYTHASPTLFNSGTTHPQLASCFLLNVEDNIDDLFDVVKECAKISKRAGGIGISISKIRSRGSLIEGTGGSSDGVVPMANLYNSLARWINQGGKRKGAIALYLEPWHGDIFEFCDLKKREGKEEMRARDLFLGLWIPDIFMRRVKNNEMWSLMCPNKCKGLVESYGEKFEELYLKYEKEGKYIKKVKAIDLWNKIINNQIETGTPYMLYKDTVNKFSNQKNIGTIKSSNLCSEIVEYTDDKNTAVCNLASISLPKFVKYDDNDKPFFDFDELLYVSQVATKNLNCIIDRNSYPVDKAKNSNMNTRPIGLGVQGLVDTFCKMKLSFGSDKALQLDKNIFETIYYGALMMSNKLAKIKGSYNFFENSPASKGILQFHYHNMNNYKFKYDWNSLIDNIKKYGLRNSLVTACMPTASTSQIMGNQESIEPFTTNLYSRYTLSGEYVVMNKYLINDLKKNNLWNERIKNEFIFDQGSIQNIDCIPYNLKKRYKTANEIGNKIIQTHAIARAPFIDQSQSMNIFMDRPTIKKLSASHFYAWKNNLKTGMYYLRSQPSLKPDQFGLDEEIINKIKLDRFNKNNTNIKNIDSSHLERIKNYNDRCTESCSG